jgi:branched-chain amino acid transport system substrate-binding protein
LAIRDGIVLAFEERENVTLGGVTYPIELVFGDIFDGEAGTTEAERVITVDGVRVIIGSYGTAAAISSSEVADTYGVPFLETTQWDDYLTERNFTRYFRLCPKSSTYAETFAEVVLDTWTDELGETAETMRVAVVADQWSTYVVNPMIAALNASGCEPVFISWNPWNIEDFTPIIEQLKLLDIDLLIAEHIVPSAVLFRQQMLALDFEPRAVFPMGVGWEQSAFLDGVGEENVEGVALWGWVNPTMNFTKALAFRTDFYQRFNYYPTSPHPMLGYSGMHFLLDMMEEAGVYDEAAIANAIAAAEVATGEYAMWWGVDFDEDGDNLLAEQHGIFQWQDGNLECVWPEEWATADWRRYW